MGRLLARLRHGGAGVSRPAVADEFDLSVDLRALSTDATQSRLTGGLGKLRFDGTRTGCAWVMSTWDIAPILPRHCTSVRRPTPTGTMTSTWST